MKKRNFWLTGIAVAAIVSMALLLGCPTSTDDDPPAAPSPGFYVGSVLTDVSDQTGANLIENSLAWLKTKAEANGEYKIVLGADLTVTPVEVIDSAYHVPDNPRASNIGIMLEVSRLNNASGATITFTSVSASDIKKIKLGGKGYLLHVGSKHPSMGGAEGDADYEGDTEVGPDGNFKSPHTIKTGPVTVVLENIILQGLTLGKEGAADDNDSPLVSIGGLGAKVIMKKGARITGNTHSGPDLNNSYNAGAGVNIRRGVLLMEDGSIDTNHRVAPNDATNAMGGGLASIHYAESLFDLRGGTVTQNSVKATAASARGGAIWVHQGSFHMSGGSITNNLTQAATGAVRGTMGTWSPPHEVKITGGTIKNNNAVSTSGTSPRVFAGLEVQEDQKPIFLDGSPDLQDPIVLYTDGELFGTIKLGPNFNPSTPVTVDFYTFSDVSQAQGGGWAGLSLVSWETSSSTALPVSKFKLGKWRDTAQADILGSIGTDGKYVAP
ncbi:hypothetical protein AGMMS4952_17930 [Spirochaetia bacterium]|nr:hypothetical protein AGMMS4952_17930 [Spirochaetia bacterium]